MKLKDCKFFRIPVGLVDGDYLHKALSGTSPGSSEYNKNVLVALLNQKLLSTTGTTPTNCVPASQVDEMALGAFDPKSGKSAWGKTEISNYLKTNNLSRD
ncbi:hypothetical protein CLD22_00285 [Rubrivivax gelatinosus]|nr:hypothetical protein [Rubrivivax gelatinosus]